MLQVLVVVHVKKEGEDSHSAQVPLFNENEIDNHINIFVDDFIASGATLRRVYKSMVDKFPNFKLDVICVTGSHTETDKMILDVNPKYVICSVYF